MHTTNEKKSLSEVLLIVFNDFKLEREFRYFNQYTTPQRQINLRTHFGLVYINLVVCAEQINPIQNSIRQIQVTQMLKNL